MEFPKLVIKSQSKGKTIRKVWQIKTKIDESKNEIILMTESGEIGGRIVTKQKKLSNINLSSKKGISSLEKYAEEEAKKLFNKQKKLGYKEMDPNSKESDEEGNNDFNEKEKENINKRQKKEKKINNEEEFAPQKTYFPMLAHPFDKKKKEIKYPCFVQPKLDGVRCIAVGNKLFSRNGIEIQFLDHIKNELKLNKDKLILDGELYTDDINFEKIVGLVKKTKKMTPEEQENSLKLYLNVFDYIDTDLAFEERLKNLNKFFQKNKNMQYIKQVKTEDCTGEEQVMEYLEKYTKEGYEGVIIRNKHGKYAENARSNHLQKLKKFIDEEFEIIDFTSATTGKEIGCVVWICKTKEGKKFNVRPLGSYEERKKQYKDGKKYIGKKITVKYQELTNDHIPRFPVGLAIRDYE